MEFIAQFFDLILHLDKHLAVLIQQYGVWIYAILFAIIFCETGLVICPFLPGDSLLFVAGALAATSVTGAPDGAAGLDIGVLCAVLFSAAVLGDNVNYWIGHAVGPRAFRWEQSRIFNKAALMKTHAFYETHGGKTIIIARFFPFARTFAPFVAGIGRMNYLRYVTFELAGSTIWIGSLTLGGYWFGNLPYFKNNLSTVIFGIMAISLLPVAVGWFKHRQSQRCVG